MADEKIQLYSLPGFMGEPADWKALLGENKLYDHICCDLYDNCFTAPKMGLWSWAESFNHYVKKRQSEMGFQLRPVVLAYSLGGRLALHSLCLDPRLWGAAIIVSAHPGLSSWQERSQRQRSDQEWAKRFLVEPWDKLIASWQAQSIFKGHNQGLSRSEENICRKTLADTLEYWSLSQQDDLSRPLEQLYLPFLWVVGELDEKFRLLTERIELRHPNSAKWVAVNCSHRVPWDCYRDFERRLNQFCETIYTDI